MWDSSFSRTLVIQEPPQDCGDSDCFFCCCCCFVVCFCQCWKPILVWTRLSGTYWWRSGSPSGWLSNRKYLQFALRTLNVVLLKVFTSLLGRVQWWLSLETWLIKQWQQLLWLRQTEINTCLSCWQSSPVLLLLERCIIKSWMFLPKHTNGHEYSAISKHLPK